MTSYSPKVLEYYEQEFKYYDAKLYEYFVNNKYITDASYEDFSDNLAKIKAISVQLGKDLVSFTKSLFHITSKLVLKLTHNYDLLFKRYTNFIFENEANIDENKFENTQVKCVSKKIILERLNTVTKLFGVISNVELAINSSNTLEGSSIEQCFDFLSDIGFDASTNSISSKPSESYKRDTKSNTVGNFGYSLSELKSLLQKIRGIDKYTSRSFLNKTNKAFTNLSNKLTDEQRDLDRDDPEYKEIRNKLMRLWWCSHFIKATYTIANDIVSDLVTLCEAARHAYVKQEN